MLCRAVACLLWLPLLCCREQVVHDILRCVSLERASAAVDAALHCIVQMSRSPALQDLMLRSGALPHVVPLLLRYDGTAEGETRGDTRGGGGAAAAVALRFDDEEGVVGAGGGALPAFLGLGPQQQQHAGSALSVQAALNHHAVLAARALAALAGFPGADPATPPHPDAQAALTAVLTPPLAPRLAERDPRSLLQELNSTVQQPQVVGCSMRDPRGSAHLCAHVHVSEWGLDGLHRT
jgi:DnaJ family protein C protein 13